MKAASSVLVFGTAFLLCGCLSASAATLSIQNSVSAFIRTQATSGTTASDATGMNYGGHGNIIVGTTAPLTSGPQTGQGASPLRGLLSFSLAGLPANAVITGIALRLAKSTDANSVSGNLTVDLHLLNRSFVEGGGNAGDTSGVSWNYSGAGTTNPWITPGGDYGDELSTLQANPRTGTSHTFTSTSAFVAAAQAAYSGSSALDLLIKLEDETLSASRRVLLFGSDDASSLTVPVLDITYDVIPEPSTALLSAVGCAALLRRRRN